MTTDVDYVFSNDWKDARQRLGLLEEVFDPGTIRHLEQIGVGDGWQCLEAGAGAGSIARWLSMKVGSSGRVLATDIDTCLLDALTVPNLEVQHHDIVADPLPESAFDHMVAALKPGGWLLVEEPDYVSEDIISYEDAGAPEVFRRVREAKTRFHQLRGFDRFYGRRVFDELRTRGMTNVSSEGRSAPVVGPSRRSSA